MIFDHAAMKSLSAPRLSEWAEQLLRLGYDADSIVVAVTNPDLSREKIEPLLLAICDDLGLDASLSFVRLKEAAYIREYESGHFTATHVLFACNRFRSETGFPEQLTAKLVYDAGVESVSYHGLETGVTGDELEQICLEHLERHGIERSR